MDYEYENKELEKMEKELKEKIEAQSREAREHIKAPSIDTQTTDFDKSPVDNISSVELEAFKSEASAAFSKKNEGIKISEAATIRTGEDGIKTLAISFDKTLTTTEIGAMGLRQDISRSAKNPNEGIRDFYHVSYDHESTVKVREKENYLNLPLTGNPVDALRKLTRFEDKNKFNLDALETFNDGTHTNMERIHRAEREKNDTGLSSSELLKKHAVEVELFKFNETTHKTTLSATQSESFDTLRQTHKDYKETLSGKQVNPARIKPLAKDFLSFRETQTNRLQEQIPTQRMS